MKITKLFMTLALALTLSVPSFSNVAFANGLLEEQAQETTEADKQKDEPKIIERMGAPGGPMQNMPNNPFVIPLSPEALDMLNGITSHSTSPSPEMLQEAYHSIWKQVADNYYDVTKLKDWYEWKHKYDGKLKTVEEFETALQAMLSSLGDNWTSYTSTADMNEARERFEKGIIESGIALAKSGDSYKIRFLSYGSSAYQSNLRRGDEVKSINEVSLEGKSLEEVEDMVRAKVGDALRIVVNRGGTDLNLTLIVQPPARDGVQAGILAGKIGYVRLHEFSGRSLAQFKMALIQLHQSAHGHLNGLVLDLRGNPGGEIGAAVSIAEIFLKEGTIFSTVTREKRRISNEVTTVTPPQTYELKDAPPSVAMAVRDYYAVPMVVLVDGSSASSSEILTGALKDNKRAVIMGTTTWGKGVGMRVASIPPGGRLSITSLTYATPSGFNLHGKGIEPHVVVERHSGANHDEQLDAAIDYFMANNPSPFDDGMPNFAEGPNNLSDFLSSPLGQSVMIALLLLLVVLFGYHRRIQLQRDREAREEANRKDSPDRY